MSTPYDRSTDVQYILADVPQEIINTDYSLLASELSTQTGLTPGERVEITGYYSVGDGGGGFGTVVSDTGQVVDEGTYFSTDTTDTLVRRDRKDEKAVHGAEYGAHPSQVGVALADAAALKERLDSAISWTLTIPDSRFTAVTGDYKHKVDIPASSPDAHTFDLTGAQFNGANIRGPGNAPNLYLWEGEWIEGRSYRNKAWVLHNNQVWRSKQPTNTVEPGTDPVYWELLRDATLDKGSYAAIIDEDLSAGDTVVSVYDGADLQNVKDRLEAGKKAHVYVQSYDLMYNFNFGYPPAPRNISYHEVDSVDVNAGTVTLKSGVKDDHLSGGRAPASVTLWEQGGNEATDLTIKNLNLEGGNGGEPAVIGGWVTKIVGDQIVIDESPLDYLWPVQCKHLIVEGDPNSPAVLDGNWEHDKMIEQVTYRNCLFGSKDRWALEFASSCRRIDIYDSTAVDTGYRFYGFRRVYWHNCDIQALEGNGVSFGHDYEAYYNCTLPDSMGEQLHDENMRRSLVLGSVDHPNRIAYVDPSDESIALDMLLPGVVLFSDRHPYLMRVKNRNWDWEKEQYYFTYESAEAQQIGNSFAPSDPAEGDELWFLPHKTYEFSGNTFQSGGDADMAWPQGSPLFHSDTQPFSITLDQDSFADWYNHILDLDSNFDRSKAAAYVGAFITQIDLDITTSVDTTYHLGTTIDSGGKTGVAISGTVSASNGTVTASESGAFNHVIPGDTINFDPSGANESKVVDTVDSDTQLTLVDTAYSTTSVDATYDTRYQGNKTNGTLPGTELGSIDFSTTGQRQLTTSGVTEKGGDNLNQLPNNGLFANFLTLLNSFNNRDKGVGEFTITIEGEIEYTTPAISNFAASNPTSKDVEVVFDNTEQLTAIDVGISGVETGSLELSDFTETNNSDGTYSYVGTYSGSADGTYTATINSASASSGSLEGGHNADVTVDTVAPTITNYALTSSALGELQVQFDSNETLDTIQVSITGPRSHTFTEDDFTESAGTYTANKSFSKTGVYTATLDTATDANGNDGGGASDTYDLQSVAKFLDTLTSNAASAYSVARLINGNYNGPSMRIIRTADSVEGDVMFDGDNLITMNSVVTNRSDSGSDVDLSTFVGSGDAKAVTLYDQSGNSNNLTGSAGAPFIISGGAFETLPEGTPAARFPNSDRLFSDTSLTRRVALFVAVATNSTPARLANFRGSGGGAISGNSGTWGDWNDVTYINGQQTTAFNVDQSQIGVAINNSISTGNLWFGGTNDMFVSEFVVLESDSDDPVQISDKLNDYYGIY